MTAVEVAAVEAQGAEYARRSRAAQGLPPTVEDPQILGELGRLVRVGLERPAGTEAAA